MHAKESDNCAESTSVSCESSTSSEPTEEQDTSEDISKSIKNAQFNGLNDLSMEEKPPLIKMIQYEQFAMKYKPENNAKPSCNGEQAVGKRKTGRINLKKSVTSPKSVKTQVVDCLQQANLNSFLQIKEVFVQEVEVEKASPRKYKTKSKDKDNAGDTPSSFKVSCNLFMSPRSKKCASRQRIKDNDDSSPSKSNRVQEVLENGKLEEDNEDNNDVEVSELITTNDKTLKEISPDVLNTDDSVDKTDLMIVEKDVDTPALKPNAFRFLMDRTRVTPPSEKSSPKNSDSSSKKRKLDLQPDEDNNKKRTKRRKSGQNTKEDDNIEVEILADEETPPEEIKIDVCSKKVKQVQKSKLPLKEIINNEETNECNQDLSFINEIMGEIEAKKVSVLQGKKNKNSGAKKFPPSKLSLKKSPEVVTIEEVNYKNVRRSTRVRKSIVTPILFDDECEKTPKSNRKRLSSESSVDSIASVASATSVISSKSDKKGRQRKSKNLQENKTGNGKKMAPVFDKARPKPKLSPASLAARESFLRSGVPEILKQKQQKIEARLVEEEELFFSLPTVAHVQQRCSSFVWSLTSVNIPLISSPEEKINILTTTSLSSCNNIINGEDKPVTFTSLTKGSSLFKEFQRILDEKPNHPVRHIFLTFGDRNGLNYRPQKQQKSKQSLSKLITKEKPLVVCENRNQHTMWTKKYRPKRSTDLVGNTEAVKSLKTWLQSWLEVVGGPGGEMFDADGASLLKNTMILYGRPGCGKSATAYALCEELGINVLEVNVSSRRTGKQLLQQMHEATQSHQVRKHNDLEAKMCLLLIDDVDLVYQQDEQFTRELHTLITSSKRPIILITNDYSVPHVIKYINQQYPVLSFAGLSAYSMGTYLQILCLMEGAAVDRKILGMLLESNLGDMRRTLLQLQFWLGSGGDSNESLSLNSGEGHRKCIQAFISHPQGRILPEPLDLGALWWNVPNVIGSVAEEEKKTATEKSKKAKTLKARKELENYASFMDSISFCDTLNRTEGITGGLEPDANGLELFDSVELNPRTDYFKTNRYLTEELEQTLLEAHCKRFVGKKNDLSTISDKWTYAAPAKIRRWRGKQENCTSVYQRAVPIQIYYDKASFYRDYFPYLRELSRIEEERRENNPKRGNRGFNVLGTAGIFDISPSDMKTACKMLQVDDSQHYV